MKYSIPLLALATAVNAHYTLPAFVGQANWQHGTKSLLHLVVSDRLGETTNVLLSIVRQWIGYYTNGPVTDVNSLDIRCNVGGSTVSAPSTLSVAAGSTLSFKVDPNIYHAGPELVYLAKVPSGKTAANWDGSGAVWFKVYQQGPTLGGGAISWPNLCMSLTFPFLLVHLFSIPLLSGHLDSCITPCIIPPSPP